MGISAGSVMSGGRSKWLLLVLVFLVVTLLLPAMPVLAAGGTWSSGPNLITTRGMHAAVLLSDGQVLVSGGWNGIYLRSAEIYDLATNLWSAAGDMATGRQNHSMVLLPSGKVLAVCGNDANPYIATAELFDPTTKSWSSAGTMSTARNAGIALLLPTGKVLAIGGSDGSDLASAELYDYLFNTWSLAAPMNSARIYPAAVLLGNGKVLVIGGGRDAVTQRSAELYDPETGTWSAVTSMNTARGSGHSATVLANGKVLVAGGGNNDGILASAEVYDPAENSWSSVANMNGTRSGQTATLLPDGTVLVTGGWYGGGVLATTEIYDPVANTWSSAGTMSITRCDHTATKLQNNKVLIAAGHQYGSEAGALSSTQFFITNQPPAQPVNLSPGNGAINISLTPALVSSAFVDPDTGDTHLASQWQITTGSYSSPAYDSGTDTSNKTQITIPSGELNYNATYYWRVRHQDNHGAWSNYSSETYFTTGQQSTPPTSGRRSLPDPGTFAMVGSGLGTALLYIGLSRLRWRLSRS